MAFGKKKQDEPVAAPASEVTPDEQPEDQLLGGALDGAAEADAEDDAISAGIVVAEKAAAAADPLAGDLLNMFQTTNIEAEDLSVIIELAGDVEIDDLLEELHTVALALGCQLEEVAADDAEMLAA